MRPVTPARLTDIRIGTKATTVPIAEHYGIPLEARAIILNAQVRAPTNAGLHRHDASRSRRASPQQLSFAAKTSTSNLVVVLLEQGGLSARVSAGTTRLLLDVVGCYE